MRKKLNIGDWVTVVSLDDNEESKRYPDDVIENSRRYEGKRGKIIGTNVAKAGRDSFDGVEWFTEDETYQVEFPEIKQPILLPSDALKALEE